jgi:hypothetical protein
LTIAVAAVAFFALASPCLADPGSPGLADASQAVYPNPGQGVSDVPGTLAFDPGGSANGPTFVSATDVSGGETGLPMTGLAALPMLLAGLIAIGLGMTLRVALRDPSGF